VASVWIRRRPRKNGALSFRVEYRPGGREASVRFGGSFPTLRLAKRRRDYLLAEMASGRMPDLRPFTAPESAPQTLRQAARRWQESRVDVAEGTKHTYRVNLERILRVLGDRAVDSVTVSDVTALVAELASLKRESLRKTLSTLAQVLDHAGVEPNPVRSPKVKLPRGERREVNPPTAAHIEAVVRILPTRYRLPTLVLDATGMRIGELEALTWGDVDEPHSRFRVSAAVSKSGRARWVNTPAVVFQAVSGLVAREDRTDTRPVFQGFGADRFRTALARACRGAGVPTFSPHDLRHRRVSLMHEQGVSWARIGELVGHGDIVTTARTYTHVLGDAAELDYEEVLR